MKLIRDGVEKMIDIKVFLLVDIDMPSIQSVFSS